MAKQLEPFYVQLGRRVAERRAELSFSQQALGEAMQPRLTRASIANIENAKQRVLAHTLVELAFVLRCELDALVGPSVSSADHAIQQEVAKELLAAKVPVSTVDELSRTFGLADERRSPR